MNVKLEIMAALKREFHRWDDLLAELKEDQVAEPLEDSEWTVKDLVAHLLAWQQVTNARLNAALRDELPVYPDWQIGLDPESEGTLDKFNARIFQTFQNQPWEEVYWSWRDGFQKVINLADQIPEANLLEEDKFTWLPGHALIAVLDGTLAHHHQEHLEALLAALPDNS